MGDWVFNFDDLQSELNVGPSAYIPPSFASSTNQPHPDTVIRSFQRRDAITSITEHEEWNVSTEDVQTDLDRTLETIRYMKTMEGQAMAVALTRAVNNLMNKNHSTFISLTFLEASVAKLDEPVKFVAMERFLSNSNSVDWHSPLATTEPCVQYAVAFTPWTWAATNGYLMVVDLQGQRVDHHTLVLTDPAIHCIDGVFKRMLTQHKTVDTTSKWTNRFVASSTEMAFQTWSVAFYSTSARTLMLCVVLVHMLVTTVDFTFSQAYVYFMVSGLLCFQITRELDLCHRTNFLHYYNAEKSAEALELIVYNECKAEEMQAVAQTIDENAELCAKLQVRTIIDLEYRIKDLALKRVIGQGAYGEVILAEFCGTMVVLKRMHRHKITRAAVQEFTDEILLMCQLRHPNIVQFIGASWNTYSNIGFVLEYVGHGDLYVIIHDKRVAKSWSDPLHRIAVDSARGICYLHSKNIIHQLKANEKQVGTPLWTAPEVVTGGQFSLKSDVYAFGIILTELITRKTPYADKTKTMSAYKVGGRILLGKN
ncbi:hypothetical protein DYB25_006087 [Aphanomyces astaci]|uniref:Protein kinase domain-containing protein n=2 Tax=Aphanomyces astaci TaxID=112090 RepID=A0A397BFY9_APHAT|nr:hypothetical protein DYB25_006087 [Aphanomyces astaci]